MFKRSSLWSTALIGSLVGVSITSAVAAENVIIPNFASADFGWLLQGGIDFRTIPGKGPPITFDPAYPQRPGNQRGVMERMSERVFSAATALMALPAASEAIRVALNSKDFLNILRFLTLCRRKKWNDFTTILQPPTFG